MYSKIPYELKELNNWCCFKKEWEEQRQKYTKRPYTPTTNTLAKSNDPNTWVSFDEALEHVDNYDGIGFFFTAPYIGVDIDDVSDQIEAYKENDEVENTVSEFIELLSSYAEISPSGNGIHIIVKGELPPNGRRKGNIEIYDKGRFFTMTGNNIGGYQSINDDNDYGHLKFLHSKYIETVQDNKMYRNTSDGAGNNLTLEEIYTAATNSKKGLRFKTLFEGNWEQFYASQSDADMALVSDLAFWTARDPKKMDDMFRKSKLYRGKWDEMRGEKTYGEMTIQKAIDSTTSEFIPLQTDDDFQIHLLDDTTVRPVKKKYYGYDDTGNAERLRDRFGHIARFNFTSKKWMYYDGKIWTYDMIGKMKQIADEVIHTMKKEKVFVAEGVEPEEAKKLFNKHIKTTRNHNGKTNMLKEAQHLLPITPDALDTNPHLFNVQNGYINLLNGEYHEHDKNKYFTRISNAEYTDNSDCPIWEEFLNDIFLGNQELVHYIQRAIGYTLSGSTKEQVMFVLYGNGRNGKSVFLDILNEIFGSYSANIRPQAIMATKSQSDASPEIAKLDGARLVTTTEPNEGERFDEGLIKQLTGGDKVTARKLYENEFEFIPQFKLWMATNHKPYIRGRDEGIWRRMVIIPFDKQIPLHEIDYELTNKLKTELNAIIKWCVDGYLEWQKTGLQEPQIIKQQRDEYRIEMDSIEAFIDECCEKGSTPDHRVKASELFQAYREWATENNQYQMTSTKFGIDVAKKFNKVRSNGTYYMGLKLIKGTQNEFFKMKY